MASSDVESQLHLSIHVSHWTNSKKKLFDYQEKLKISASSFEYSILKPISIYRKSKKCALVADLSEKIEPNDLSNCLNMQLRLNQDLKKVQIEFTGTIIPRFPVKYLKDKNKEPIGHALQAGDHIMLGNVSLMVSEIKREGQLITTDSQKLIKRVQSRNQPSKYDQLPACRLCFDDSSTLDDPLIESPCNCAGSCKWIHVDCLKTWFKTKMSFQFRQHAIVIDRVSCEICKGGLPWKIKTTAREHQILPLPRPKTGNYLILSKAPGRQEEQVIIFKHLPYEGLSMGRDSSCFIKLQQITVSRVHAFIKQCDGQFVLFDNNSKFGTTVQKENRKQYLGKKAMVLQVEDCLVELRVEKVKEPVQNEGVE